MTRRAMSVLLVMHAATCGALIAPSSYPFLPCKSRYSTTSVLSSVSNQSEPPKPQPPTTRPPVPSRPLSERPNRFQGQRKAQTTPLPRPLPPPPSSESSSSPWDSIKSATFASLDAASRTSSKVAQAVSKSAKLQQQEEKETPVSFLQEDGTSMKRTYMGYQDLRLKKKKQKQAEEFASTITNAVTGQAKSVLNSFFPNDNNAIQQQQQEEEEEEDVDLVLPPLKQPPQPTPNDQMLLRKGKYSLYETSPTTPAAKALFQVQQQQKLQQQRDNANRIRSPLVKLKDGVYNTFDALSSSTSSVLSKKEAAAAAIPEESALYGAKAMCKPSAVVNAQRRRRRFQKEEEDGSVGEGIVNSFKLAKDTVYNVGDAVGSTIDAVKTLPDTVASTTKTVKETTEKTIQTTTQLTTELTSLPSKIQTTVTSSVQNISTSITNSVDTVTSIPNKVRDTAASVQTKANQVKESVEEVAGAADDARVRVAQVFTKVSNAVVRRVEAEDGAEEGAATAASTTTSRDGDAKEKKSSNLLPMPELRPRPPKVPPPPPTPISKKVLDVSGRVLGATAKLSWFVAEGAVKGGVEAGKWAIKQGKKEEEEEEEKDVANMSMDEWVSKNRE